MVQGAGLKLRPPALRLSFGSETRVGPRVEEAWGLRALRV